MRRVVLAALLAACSSPSRGHTLADIKARGVLTYGADVAGSEPYLYEDPKDPSHLLGFEVEMIDALARRIGVRAEMKQVRVVEPGAVARARRLRRRDERPRGDRGARRPRPAVGAVLHVRGDPHRAARRAVPQPRRPRRQAGRDAEPDRRARPAARAARRGGAVRGQRRAVPRSRAGPARRGAARQHHRAALRLHDRASDAGLPAHDVALGTYVIAMRKGDGEAEGRARRRARRDARRRRGSSASCARTTSGTIASSSRRRRSPTTAPSARRRSIPPSSCCSCRAR